MVYTLNRHSFLSLLSFCWHIFLIIEKGATRTKKRVAVILEYQINGDAVVAFAFHEQLIGFAPFLSQHLQSASMLCPLFDMT